MKKYYEGISTIFALLTMFWFSLGWMTESVHAWLYPLPILFMLFVIFYILYVAHELSKPKSP